MVASGGHVPLLPPPLGPALDLARLCSPGLRTLNLGLQACHLELFPTSYVASYNECRLYCACTARQCKPMDRYFAECSIINPTFIGFAEASRYWSVQFFSAFYWPNSIGRPILCQDYGVIQSSLVNVKRATSL